MLLLPALAAQAGPAAAWLRSAGWAATCVCEPCACCASHLLGATLSVGARLGRLSSNVAARVDARLGASRRATAGYRAVGAWSGRVVAPMLGAAWHDSRASGAADAASRRVRSVCTQLYLVRELRMLTKLHGLEEAPPDTFLPPGA